MSYVFKAFMEYIKQNEETTIAEILQRKATRPERKSTALFNRAKK